MQLPDRILRCQLGRTCWQPLGSSNVAEGSGQIGLVVQEGPRRTSFTV